MSILSPLKKLLGNVEQGGANLYNNTVGSFTGNIGPIPKGTLTENDPQWRGLYKPTGLNHLQAPQLLQPFNNYRPAAKSIPQARPLMVAQQYINHFLPVSQQLQPFGFQGEDAYTPSQAVQPLSYNNGQASLNGQLTQGPMASYYRLMGQ